MDRLDWRFNNAVVTLKDVNSDALKIVVADAIASSNSTVWPAPKKVSDAELFSAVGALNEAAQKMDDNKKEAVQIVIDTAMGARSSVAVQQWRRG